jgi:hypothetical protein
MSFSSAVVAAPPCVMIVRKRNDFSVDAETLPFGVHVVVFSPELLMYAHFVKQWPHVGRMNHAHA